MTSQIWHRISQPRCQGSLQRVGEAPSFPGFSPARPTERARVFYRSVGWVGENPGNEVGWEEERERWERGCKFCFTCTLDYFKAAVSESTLCKWLLHNLGLLHARKPHLSTLVQYSRLEPSGRNLARSPMGSCRKWNRKYSRVHLSYRKSQS